MDAASTLQHSLPILFRRLLCLSAVCAAISALHSAPTRLLLSLPTHSPLHSLPHSAFLIHSYFFTASTAAQSPHASLRRFRLIGFQPILLLFAFLQLFILGGSLSFFNLFFPRLHTLLPPSLPPSVLYLLSFLLPCLHLVALFSSSSSPPQFLLLVFFIPPAFLACFLSVFLLAQFCN